jgi:hypothetical protein
MKKMSLNLIPLLLVIGFSFLNPAGIFGTCTQPDLNIFCDNCRTTPTLHISVCIDPCESVDGVRLKYREYGSPGGYEELILTETVPCYEGCDAWVGEATHNVVGCLEWVLKCGDSVIASSETFGNIECCDDCD